MQKLYQRESVWLLTIFIRTLTSICINYPKTHFRHNHLCLCRQFLFPAVHQNGKTSYSVQLYEICKIIVGGIITQRARGYIREYVKNVLTIENGTL